jgi:hypothetical protein
MIVKGTGFKKYAVPPKFWTPSETLPADITRLHRNDACEFAAVGKRLSTLNSEEMKREEERADA